jgi:zinc D-Ala-D-Ala carboxypeptidase
MKLPWRLTAVGALLLLGLPLAAPAPALAAPAPALAAPASPVGVTSGPPTTAEAPARPATTITAVRYVRYSWAPDIYAHTTGNGAETWRLLSYADWAAAGYPRPEPADFIPGTLLRTYNRSATIWATLNGTVHALTFAEWAAMRYRQPTDIINDYVKYAWAPGIYAVGYAPDGIVWRSLSYEDWSAAGFPAPRNAGWIEGTSLVQYGGAAAILARSPDNLLHLLSYGEWAATGFRPFQTVGSINNALSPVVVVNKRRPLSPLSFAPGDLVALGGQAMRAEAAAAMRALIGSASASGVPVTAVSGFRSYETQAALYNNYVAMYGQAAADLISARPGFSEHQTGLTLDIGNPNGACGLQPCFAGTPAGAWAAANAFRFGFIVRYPEGATGITGYSFEPWHLRYVGTDVAGQMRAVGTRTLEEFFGLPAAPGY